jgi:O-acetyl-ADP-ribose deacetylase (regulator of RNase III)
MEPRKYQFNNSTLTIVFGDIMNSQLEVIVSSDDTGISMGGGISGCILKAGGESIRHDAQKKLPAQLGDVVVSTAGLLERQKFIFHCLTIDYEHKTDVYEGRMLNSEELNNYILQHSIDKCFRLLQALELNSIAFPCIGAGLAHIPLKKVAEVMAEAISANLCRTQRAYQIELYLFDRNHVLTEMDYIDMFENFAISSALTRYQSQISTGQMVVESSSKSSKIKIPKREEMKHQVFISYSRKDEGMIDGILAILEENHILYWIDKKGIFSGENYKEVIVDAIEVAKVVIFISSANSNASINVIRELGYAVQQRKTIIPVLLDEAQYAKSIRLDIADIDQIDYKDVESATKKLVASLAYSLGVGE